VILNVNVKRRCLRRVSDDAVIVLLVYEILAIVLSPVIALAVGQLVSSRKEKTSRRHQVFQSLWLTRGDLGSMGRLSPEHVRALNSIQIEFSKTRMDEFYGVAERCDAVLAAWRNYLAAMYVAPFDDPGSPAAIEFFNARDMLLVEVLFEMSGVLGYLFSREEIRATAYVPQHHLDVEAQVGRLRAALVEVAEGRQPLRITDAAPSSTAAALPPAPAVATLPEGSKSGA
jgi:hypothetical protein